MPVSRPRQEHEQAPQGERAGRAAATVDDPAAQDGATAGAASPGAEARELVVERDERRAKMERLRSEGIEPYPHVRLPDRTKIADVLAAHDPSKLAHGEHPELPYHLAGRLVSRRGHGKTSFLDLRDLSGTIQIVLRADALGQEAYERILNLDVGDIIGVRGCAYVTQRGGLALAAHEVTLLTKALRPPPDKRHGLGDTGTRYRYRELDLIANERTRELFLTRAKIVAAIRELMLAYAASSDVARATEEMFADVARRVLGRTELNCHGETIDLAKPWRRITMREAILQQTGVDFMAEDRAAVTKQLAELLEERVHPATTWAGLTHAVYTKLIEPNIIQPTHVFDFPLEPFPITKRHAEHPELAEHFDAVIGGVELVSGDTELNDPVDQWQRFVEQRQRRTLDDEDLPHPNDEEYARAIEHGYSPTAGGGMGVDRLVMILTGRESLREVIPVPIVRELR